MKAVPDDYQTRPMHVLCEEALEQLRDATEPRRCGYIGEQLFWDATHRGSAPFARIAGKVMKRLKDAGLAEWSNGGWVISEAGRKNNKTKR